MLRRRAIEAVYDSTFRVHLKTKKTRDEIQSKLTSTALRCKQVFPVFDDHKVYAKRQWPKDFFSCPIRR